MSACAGSNPVPTYSQFAAILFQNLNPQEQSLIPNPEREPRKVFELLAERRGDRWLKDRICEYTRIARAGEVHKAFARIPWLGAITTNHDTLVEDALKDLGWAVIRCASDAEASNFLQRNEVNRQISVAKIHGDCDHYNSMIVRPSSLTYERYGTSHPEMLRFLDQALRVWSAFFIGYSLQDPNVTFLREVLEVRQRSAGSEKRQDYVLLINPEDEQEEAWREQGLCPISITRTTPEEPDTAVLLNFLSDIADYCSQPVPKKPLASGIAPNAHALAFRAKWAPGFARTEYEECGYRLDDLLPMLRDDGNCVVPLWVSSDLVEPWKEWLEVLAQRLESSVLAIAYESLRPDTSVAIARIVEYLTDLRVPAAIVDFSERVTATAAATACKRSGIPVLASARNRGDIPVAVVDFIAKELYSDGNLSSRTSTTLESLCRRLERVVLVHRFSEAEAHLRSRRYDEAALVVGSLVETGVRILIREICDGEGDVDTTNVRAMIGYLAREATPKGLEIDRADLNWAYDLRVHVAHGEGSASKQLTRNSLRMPRPEGRG